MFDQVKPPSVEDSQLRIVPTEPVKLSVPLFKVSHTVVVPFKTPPMATGSTVIVAMVEVSALQTPLFTETRYDVVVTKFEYDCVLLVFANVNQVIPPSVED